ncbi:MAG: phosphatase PAP2 family protein [Erysipelotrichaceae bacterium]|nr:phosphatase PAP2 family protein [Erysipelotrichaceae bacterium]
MKKFLKIVWLSLFITGVFLDLQVSETLYVGSNLFNRFFEAFAMLPIIGLCVECLMSLFISTKKFYWGLLSVVASFVAAYTSLKYLDKAALSNIIVVGIVLLGISYFVAKHHTCDPTYGMRVLAGFVVLMVIMEAIKLMWGRPRYYSILEMGQSFRAVYMPKPLGLEEAFKSFPSSHTALATLSLFYVDHPLIRKYKDKGRWIVGLWIVLVAYSRIAMGWHYLTDVTMGFALSYGVNYWINRVKYCEKA